MAHQKLHLELSHPTRTHPGRVQLAKGERPLAAGEVVVLVLSGKGGVARRAKLAPGRELGSHDLMRWLASAEAAVGRCAAEPSPEAPQLTAAEASLLDEAGLVDAEHGELGALARSGIEYDLLLAESLTLEEAARMLKLKTTSRLRQRLAARSLYGIKAGRSWRLPKFQFARGALVRGIERVFPRIRSTAHPLAIKTWFSTPHADLLVGAAEKPVTPLEWLSGGQSPDVIAELVEEL